MADHQQAPAEGCQLVHQPPLGRQVEVVGRLVEDHGVGILEEHPHEVDSSTLAPRQRGDVFEEQALGQAQAVGQAGDVSLDLVAARQPVALLESGEGADGVLGRRRRHGVSGLVQLVVEYVEAAGRQHVRQGARIDAQPGGHRELGKVPQRAPRCGSLRGSHVARGDPEDEGDQR